MFKYYKQIVFGCALIVPLIALGFSNAVATPQVKPGPVDYKTQVKPLLAERCFACHGNGTKLGGLALDSRSDLLKGGLTGPAMVVGKGEASLLIKVVKGEIPGKIMPARGRRLTHAEIATLEAWIDQGASTGGADKAAAWKPTLAPRRPALPPANPALGITNPIDRLLQPYFQKHRPFSTIAKGGKGGVKPRPLVDDRAYARRIYLDTVGMLPTRDELSAFLIDTRLDKRADLARKLLADNTRYAEHWITFWNDMLRNDYAGTGYIDGGRTQITGWLFNALSTNLPYDKFVAELVNPTPESQGFIKGIVWRGVVNASQTPEMQASQNISQVFMGVNMKCASCHDSFVSTWKLVDSYGMAAIYAEKPLEIVRCDRPVGKTAQIKFMYPELGAIDPAAPRPQRMAQLARIITNRANGRLARTFVNRLWAKLMGRGLVEPADEMDNPPWSPDLLDWLASDFMDHGCDVKRLIETIVTSRAYQLPATGLKAESSESFVFTGPVVKRMSAEQFADAISQLTDTWPPSAGQLRVVKGQPMLGSGNRAEVKFQTGVMRSGSVDIDVDITGARVLQLVVTDGGNNVNSDWADWVEPKLAGPKGEMPLTSLKWHSASTGYGKVELGKSVVGKPLILGDKTFNDGIGTHANSVITYQLPEGYTRFKATAGPDSNALKQPKSETSIQIFVLTGDDSIIHTRAALALADPLTRALGRPNREQVVTERSTIATTLQALELTNGATLMERLEQGAAKLCGDSGILADAAVDRLYESALGRMPSPAERKAAAGMVGTPVTKEGVSDLLWTLTMLPEFQLIY